MFSARAALALCILALVDSTHAQQPDPPPGKTPDYPRVDRAVVYDVDPAWPQERALRWAGVAGVAVDAADNVYVFVRAQPPVRVFSPDGKLLRVWGDDALHTAHHLKIDRDGNVWAADIGLHVVRKFTPVGELLLTLGTPREPGEDQTHLDQPTDMVVTPEGHVFVADGYGNNRIVHFDSSGKFVKAFGDLGNERGDFSLPHAIDIDSRGHLYVADRNNARVQIFDQQGRFIDAWESVIVPWGFCVRRPQIEGAGPDEIWVCGSTPDRWRPTDEVLNCPPKDQIVMRFDPSGRVRQTWRFETGDGPTQLDEIKDPKRVKGWNLAPGVVDWLHAMAVDSHGNIYVGDVMGERVQKFRPSHAPPDCGVVP